MQERILSLVESLDETRKDVLARLEGLTKTQLSFRPDTDSWSPLEIVEHHIYAERGLLCNLPEPGDCVHVPPFFRHSFYRWWRRTVLQWRIPVPVPAQAMIPRGKVSLETIATMWGEDMAWLRKYVEKTPNDSLNNACFRHPVAGPLTLEQALEMAVLHIEYHLPTLEARIEAAQSR